MDRLLEEVWYNLPERVGIYWVYNGFDNIREETEKVADGRTFHRVSGTIDVVYQGKVDDYGSWEETDGTIEFEASMYYNPEKDEFEEFLFDELALPVDDYDFDYED